MYIVLEDFKAKEHDNRVYKKDAVYPADGYKSTKKRIAELAGKENKYGRPFIKEQKDEAK